jgi:hypothetical protein
MSEHYKNERKIDVIDFCNAYQLNFNKGNVVKYLARAGKKPNEPELKDLEKALDYLKREIDYISTPKKVDLENQTLQPIEIKNPMDKLKFEIIG